MTLSPMLARAYVAGASGAGDIGHMQLNGRLATVVANPTAAFGIFGTLDLELRPLPTTKGVLLRAMWHSRRVVGVTELSALLESPLFAVEHYVYDSKLIEPFARLWLELGDCEVELGQARITAKEGPECEVLVARTEGWFFLLAPRHTSRPAPLLRRVA